jgi:hypothetical protein
LVLAPMSAKPLGLTQQRESEKRFSMLFIDVS